MKTKTNVIFCGYREWALKIIEQVSDHSNINSIGVIKTIDEYREKESNFSEDTDIILFLGWSWIIPPKVTSKFLCLGVHPSDLPQYRGGSPIQNQIINGLTESKVTLMTLSENKLDAGDIWLKNKLSLKGDNIDKIFNHIIESSVSLLNYFFSQFPNIEPIKQDISKGTYFKRRQPKDSCIFLDDFKKISLVEFYNQVRCLTYPYPNLYLEDKAGNKLYIKEVEFISSQKE